MIAIVLTVLARQVSMAEKMRAHGGAHLAGMIEAQIYAALVELSKDITAHAGDVCCSEDETALAYLKTVHALLGVVALMCRQVSSDLRAMAERLAALAGDAPLWAEQAGGTPIYDLAFLDSG